jgi:hypothetical protein
MPHGVEIMNNWMIAFTALASLALVGELDAQRQGRGPRHGRNYVAPESTRVEQTAEPQGGPRPGGRRARSAQPAGDEVTGRRNGRFGGRGTGRGQVCLPDDCALTLEARATPPQAESDYLARLARVHADELEARATYEQLAEATGMRRYANLAAAEARHATAIEALITWLGGTVLDEPQSEAPDDSPDPAASAEPCADLERRVIESYAMLIETSPDPAVTAVLERIQTANRRHLAAVTDDRPARQGRRR